MGLFSPTLSIRGMMLMCHALEQTYRAGIPIHRCFFLLRGSSHGLAVRRMGCAVLAALEAGATLSQALAAQGRRLPSYFVRMVQVGEEAGALGPMFQLLSTCYTDAWKLRRRLITQITYPAILVLVIIFGIPLLRGFLLTVMHGGNMSGTFIALLPYFIGLLGALAAINLLWRIPAVTAGLKILLLYVPLFSTPVRQLGLARFGWTMEALMNAGVSTPKAIGIAAACSGNLRLQRDLGRAGQRVIQGRPLAEAFSASRFLSRADRAFIETGEVTGTAPEAFGRLARHNYESALFRLTALLAPLEMILIVLIGLWVVSSLI